MAELPCYGQRFFETNSATERCEVLNQWTSKLPPGNFVSARPAELMVATLPIFRAGVFSKFFGKSYLDLENADRTAVHTALKRCFRDWRAFGLVYAFLYNSSPYSLAWSKKVAEDERSSGPSTTASGAAISAGTAEARGGLRHPVLMETQEWIVFLVNCGGSFTSADIVARKGPEYVFSPENTEYRTFLEGSLFPALSARCPRSETFTVANYLAGIHVEHHTNIESSTAPKAKQERPINDFIVTRPRGKYEYRLSSFAESSLAGIRAARQQSAIAIASKAKAEEDARRAALENVRLAREARVQATQAVLAKLKSKNDGASKWYYGMMTAKGVSRAEALRQAGPLVLSLAPAPTQLGSPGSYAEMVKKALAGANITVSGTGAASLEVAFDIEQRRFTASGDDGSASEDFSVLSAQAWVRAPATVRRPAGFFPTRAMIAFGAAISMQKGLDVSMESAGSVIAKCLQALQEEAGRIASPAVTDEEWMDMLAVYESSAAQQSRSFIEKLAKPPAANVALAGIRKISRIDQQLSPGLVVVEKVATARPMEMLLSTIGPVKPETRKVLMRGSGPPKDVVSRWTAALPEKGIEIDPKNLPGAFLPLLVHRFGGVHLTAVRVGDSDAGPTAVTGQAVVFEPNCIVHTPKGPLRIECASAVATVVEMDAYAAGAYQAAAGNSMAALMEQLGSASSSGVAETDLLPAETYTVEVAYGRLNRRRSSGEAKPLIYRRGISPAYVAGIEKSSGEFKVIALPTMTQLRDMTRGRAWQRASAAEIAEHLRNRFEAFTFLQRNYGVQIGDPERYVDEVSQAPIMAFDVEPKAQH
ncbi:MAG: hypothetical protein ACKV2U_20980 [Bryobacteraceae bacterium]